MKGASEQAADEQYSHQTSQRGAAEESLSGSCESGLVHNDHHGLGESSSVCGADDKSLLVHNSTLLS